MSRFRLDHLFSKQNLRDYFEIRSQKVNQAIEQYHPNKLLNTPIDDLVNYFTNLGSVEAPELIIPDIYVDQAETKIELSRRFEDDDWYRDHSRYVPGTSVSLHIPFTGESELFQFRASTFSHNPPYAALLGNEVVIEYTTTSQATPEEVKRRLDSELKKLQEHLRWVQRDVHSHNNNIRGHVHQTIEARQKRLLDNQNLVASLGYPLKQRSDIPTTYVVPDVKRKAVPTPPPASTAPFAPEPVLSDKIYEQILTVLSNMVQVMEQSPSAFATMGEEDLRTHFLVQLNGQFEGRASGETFHGNGKTDILLRDQDKSIFIAECKFWKGPASLTKAIDQLLDYTTWRDAKAALLVFNRNKDFTSVVAQTPDIIRQHPQTQGDIHQIAETVLRSRLRLRDDASREVILTTMIYNIPTASSTSDRLKSKRNKKQSIR